MPDVIPYLRNHTFNSHYQKNTYLRRYTLQQTMEIDSFLLFAA